MMPTALLFLLAAALLLTATSAVTYHPDDEVCLLSFKFAITTDPKGPPPGSPTEIVPPGTTSPACLDDSRVTALSMYTYAIDPSYLSGTISTSLTHLL